MNIKDYLLSELFDSNVPIRFKAKDEHKENSVYYYEFAIDDLMYNFTAEIYTDRHGIEGEKRILNMEFALGDFYSRKDYHITGTGNALQVFSAVKQCVLDLFNKRLKEKPDIISFSADDEEPSRVKLYDRFMKIIPRILKDFKFHKKIFDEYIYKKKGT